jgi:hypothetical protein
MADEPISHVFEYEPGDWWAAALGVVGNESVDVIVDVGVAAR